MGTWSVVKNKIILNLLMPSYINTHVRDWGICHSLKSRNQVIPRLPCSLLSQWHQRLVVHDFFPSGQESKTHM